jgi:hydrogenase-4 component E
MEIALTQNIIDVCAVGMLLLSLLAMTTTRMNQLMNAFAAQSLFLVALAVTVGASTGHVSIFIVGGITFVVKVVLIPWFLKYTSQKINAGREVDSSIGIPSSLLISACLIMISYFLAAPILESFDTITRNCLAISFSVLLIGLFMMVTRRKAMTEAIGLLMMENGLFLGALSISYGMPLLVEIGVFFDVLMVAVIVGIFTFRISKTFDSIDTSFMRRLRD